MFALDKEALICDLAETYGILDMRALPVQLLATLSSGLRDHSRIKMKIAGEKISTEILLLAAMVDSLNLLVWMKTEDGKKGSNRPDSILDLIMGVERRPEQIYVFETAEEFEAKKIRIREGRAE